MEKNTHTQNMVMASLSVSQAIFFSSTPSCFNLHANKAPTFLLPSLQTNPSISLFTRTNRTPHFLQCTPNSTNDTSSNWDWNRWCRHFFDIEQAQKFMNFLKVASYEGQGRISDFGCRNPNWVNGELLQLNGKRRRRFMRGADLAFRYVLPNESSLVLFWRLKLPE